MKHENFEVYMRTPFIVGARLVIHLLMHYPFKIKLNTSLSQDHVKIRGVKLNKYVSHKYHGLICNQCK